MASTAPERQVRISRVGGRYLIFDIDDVLYIRRGHGICGILIGTMPLAPQQNLFLGLPLELYAEEAKLLVDKKVAYVADEATENLAPFKVKDNSARQAYLQSLKTQRKTAYAASQDLKAKGRALHLQKVAKAKASVEGSVEGSVEPGSAEQTVEGSVEPGGAEGSGSLFTPNAASPASTPKPVKLPHITPTTSSFLIPGSSDNSILIKVPPTYPIYAFLNARGYYITPGLRFGGDYSVYPGDPFRYHAHYMAKSYCWDEKIPMLDLTTSGRLGTAVKKSFLFGAEKPAEEGSGEEQEVDTTGKNVRVFCMEWAGM
jgi:tRNA-splicing endonuclease subunit Sen34